MNKSNRLPLAYGISIAANALFWLGYSHELRRTDATTPQASAGSPVRIATYKPPSPALPKPAAPTPRPEAPQPQDRSDGKPSGESGDLSHSASNPAQQKSPSAAMTAALNAVRQANAALQQAAAMQREAKDARQTAARQAATAQAAAREAERAAAEYRNAAQQVREAAKALDDANADERDARQGILEAAEGSRRAAAAERDATAAAAHIAQMDAEEAAGAADDKAQAAASAKSRALQKVAQAIAARETALAQTGSLSANGRPLAASPQMQPADPTLANRNDASETTGQQDDPASSQSPEMDTADKPAEEQKKDEAPASTIVLKTVKMWTPKPGQKFNLATNLNIVLPKDMQILPGAPLSAEDIARIQELMAHQNLKQVKMDRKQIAKLTRMRREAESKPKPENPKEAEDQRIREAKRREERRKQRQAAREQARRQQREAELTPERPKSPFVVSMWDSDMYRRWRRRPQMTAEGLPTANGAAGAGAGEGTRPGNPHPEGAGANGGGIAGHGGAGGQRVADARPGLNGDRFPEHMGGGQGDDGQDTGGADGGQADGQGAGAGGGDAADGGQPGGNPGGGRQGNGGQALGGGRQGGAQGNGGQTGGRQGGDGQALGGGQQGAGQGQAGGGAQGGQQGNGGGAQGGGRQGGDGQALGGGQAGNGAGGQNQGGGQQGNGGGRQGNGGGQALGGGQQGGAQGAGGQGAGGQAGGGRQGNGGGQQGAGGQGQAGGGRQGNGQGGGQALGAGEGQGDGQGGGQALGTGQGQGAGQGQGQGAGKGQGGGQALGGGQGQGAGKGQGGQAEGNGQGQALGGGQANGGQGKGQGQGQGEGSGQMAGDGMGRQRPGAAEGNAGDATGDGTGGAHGGSAVGADGGEFMAEASDIDAEDIASHEDTGFSLGVTAEQAELPPDPPVLGHTSPGALALPPAPPVGTENGRDPTPHKVRRPLITKASGATVSKPRTARPEARLIVADGQPSPTEAALSPQTATKLPAGQPDKRAPKPQRLALTIGSTSANGQVEMPVQERMHLMLGTPSDSIDPPLPPSKGDPKAQSIAPRRKPVAGAPATAGRLAGTPRKAQRGQKAARLETPAPAIVRLAKNSQGIKEGTEQPLPATPLTDSDMQIGDGSGLKGDYYRGRRFDEFAFSRADANINFDFTSTEDRSPGPKIPPLSDYTVRWTGRIAARNTETYTFYAAADDGVRVWIDHKLIIDDWTAHSLKQFSSRFTFKAGVQYVFKCEYLETNGGGALVYLYWESAHQPKQFVPEDAFFYPLPSDEEELTDDKAPY